MRRMASRQSRTDRGVRRRSAARDRAACLHSAFGYHSPL